MILFVAIGLRGWCWESDGRCRLRAHMESKLDDADAGAGALAGDGWYAPVWWHAPAERWLLLCDSCCAVARRVYWTRTLRLFATERVKMGRLHLQ